MQSTFLPFKKVEVSEYDNHPNSLMIIKVWYATNSGLSYHDCTIDQRGHFEQLVKVLKKFLIKMWFVGFQTMVIVDQYGIPFHAVLVSIIFIKRKFRLRSFKQIKPSILFDTYIYVFFYQWRPLLTSFSNRRHRECKKDAPCRKRDAPAVYCTLKMVQRLI